MYRAMPRELVPLGEFEQMVLLAVLQCRDNAYGVTVEREIKERTGRRVSPGAVYMTLDRLEKKGLLKSRLTEPTPERGGRPKRCYEITERALVALTDSRRALRNLWRGLKFAD